MNKNSYKQTVSYFSNELKEKPFESTVQLNDLTIADNSIFKKKDIVVVKSDNDKVRYIQFRGNTFEDAQWFISLVDFPPPTLFDYEFDISDEAELRHHGTAGIFGTYEGISLYIRRNNPNKLPYTAYLIFDDKLSEYYKTEYLSAPTK
ncbi:hypothetical protein ACWOBH_06050 [Globicatella sanguinis]